LEWEREKRESTFSQRLRTLELEMRRKDGTTVWTEVKVSLLRDERNQPVGILGVTRDITERKRAEKEMVVLQQQLHQAQKMEAIGQLAGGFAHDFNNALTLIKASSQLALFDLIEGDPLREKIEMILGATDRSANLARQLLAFSRRQVMEMKVLDLNYLLRELDKMLRRVIGEDIELVNVLAEDLGRVKADPGQIEEVVLNIALNARDAMPTEGKLTIETANVELDEGYTRTHVDVIPGRYVMLAVTDTGAGMPPEVRERIFEPFFTTKEKGQILSQNLFRWRP
jgi:two-component system cell cycle sensor histidine kinase/response regulator CckA